VSDLFDSRFNLFMVLGDFLFINFWFESQFFCVLFEFVLFTGLVSLQVHLGPGVEVKVSVAAICIFVGEQSLVSFSQSFRLKGQFCELFLLLLLP